MGCARLAHCHIRTNHVLLLGDPRLPQAPAQTMRPKKSITRGMHAISHADAR